MERYLGIGGFAGLDPNPFKHIRRYAAQHPDIGVALGDIGHDATAALVAGGKIVFAIEEERLNRQKHFMGVPRLAIEACEEAASAPLSSMRLAYYLDPTPEHLERRKQSSAPYLEAKGIAAMDKDFANVQRFVEGHGQPWPKLSRIDHHLAHAASAYYCSAFERSLVVVIDGQGESSSTSVYRGDERGLHLLARHGIVSSLGILYAAVTAYLGFEPIEDEYKIMGLAAYGESDEHKAFFDEIIKPEASGGFVIPSLLARPIRRIEAWDKRLGPPRLPTEPISDRHISIAYSLQKAVERAMLRLLEHHEGEQKTRHLCLAGGVALNCSMNGVIDRTELFDRMFVQPAAGDPGAALGAALVSYYQDNPGAPHHRMSDTYLGPAYDDVAVRAALEKYGAALTYEKPADYVGAVAKLLEDGKVLGWFQGRMEFGPRALGNRSILADPRRADMKDRVNQMVKKREEFRPFAPSTTSEGADQYFELRARDQYETMTIAVKARPERKHEIPAVVHVNGTARVHVVRREVNPHYWELITRFGQATGAPVVLNTSFNVKGEPVVCTPEDAVRCFLGTGIDHLAIQGYITSKKAHPA